MKKSLLTALMMTGVAALAQTTRLSLYEEFTGETCPPCASANPGLNALLLTAANQQKIVAIKWQVPIPTASSKPWSLYQTNKAEIDWRFRGWNGGTSSPLINPPSANGFGYPSQWDSNDPITSGVNSAPQGRIDGQHQWLFGPTTNHAGAMSQTAINNAQMVPSPFFLTITREWSDVAASAVNVTVNITAAQNFTSMSTLRFRLVMVEREIEFATQPGTNGEKFFEDVAIKSFPDIQNGTTLPSTWANAQAMTFTLNCPIPSWCRDKGEIAMVGFIQDDGDRVVHQAGRADKVELPNDARAVSVQMPNFECATAFTPTLSITNTGNNAITDLTITPIIDGVPYADIFWTGSMAINNTITVVGNPITPATSGGHNVTYSITGVSGGDVNGFNNGISKQFYLASGFPTGDVVESFSLTTSPTNGWMLLNPNGGGATWSHHTTANGPSYTGGTGAMKYDFYSNNAIGDQDALLFPPVSFTHAAAPKLTFDVAYRQYQSENDKLEVQASKDCGATWTSVYSKSGSVLMTVASSTAPFTPSPAQWRTETVNLTGFGNSDVIVRFVTTSDFGNNLYIDNVNLTQQCVTQSLSVSAKKTTMCVKESNTLTVVGANSVVWSSSNSTTTATGNTVVLAPPTSTGTISYTVTSTDPEGCGNSSKITLTVSACVGLEEMTLEVAHEIFPNPNNGEFLLKGNFSGKSSQMVIYNNLGQNVYQQQITAGENNIKCQLAAGVYYYTIVEGGAVAGKGNLIIR